MITFKEACEKVRGMEGSLKIPKGGTFYVKPDGFGDDRSWMVVYGAEEWLVDGDVNFLVADGDFALVSREDGSVTIDTYLNDPERYNAMRGASVG